jgi:hypothetical protein
MKDFDAIGTMYQLNRDRASSGRTVTAGLQVNIALQDDIARFRDQLKKVKALARARATFDWCEVLLPKRVTNEEIGDALELIHRIANDPTCTRPRLKIFLKTVSTVFFLFLNAFRHFKSSVQGKKAE